MEIVQTYQKYDGENDPTLGFYWITKDATPLKNYVTFYYINFSTGEKSFSNHVSLGILPKFFKKDEIRSFDGTYYYLNKQNAQEFLSEHFAGGEDLKSLLSLAIQKWQEMNIDFTHKEIITILNLVKKEVKLDRKAANKV